MCSIIGVGERLHKILSQIDLGTLDSGERLLPFGLLVWIGKQPVLGCKIGKIKSLASVEKQIVFHLVSVSVSQKQSVQDIKPFFNHSSPLICKKTVCNPFIVA